MTTFNYTSGTIANLVAGGLANMTDISGPFNDLKVFLNSASLDPVTNLAASTVFPYHEVFTTSALGNNTIVNAAATYHLSGGALLTKSGVDSGAPASFYFDPADYTMTGKTAKGRLKAHTITTLNPLGSINLVYGLYPVSSMGGAGLNIVGTVGSVVAGSTVTRNTPAANTSYRDIGSDFTLPTAGIYTFAIAISGAYSAASRSSHTVSMEVHWV